MEIEMLDWILEHAIKHSYDDLSCKITSEFTENEIKINFPRSYRKKFCLTFERHKREHPDFLLLLEDLMTSLNSETMCELGEVQGVYIAIFLLNNLKVVDDGKERIKVVLVDWEEVKENLAYQDDNFKDHYTKTVRDIQAAIDVGSQENVDLHVDRLLREQLYNLVVALKTLTVSSYLEKINGGEVVVEIAIQNTPEYNMLLHAFEEQLSEASLGKLTQRLLNMRYSQVETQAGSPKEPQTSKNTGTVAKENISRNKELCVSKESPSDSCVRYIIMALHSKKITLAIPANVERYSVFKAMDRMNFKCTPDPWANNELNELKCILNKLQIYGMKVKKSFDQNRHKITEGRGGLSPEVYFYTDRLLSQTFEALHKTIKYRETSHMETEGDCEISCDKDPPVDVETLPDKDPPVDVETLPDKDPPVDVETLPDKDPPVDVETSPDKDTSVDVETSPEYYTAVDVETSSDKDTIINVETSPDKDTSLEVETALENSGDNELENSDTQCQGSSGSVSEREVAEMNENVRGVASPRGRSSCIRKQLFPEATNKESVGSNSVPVGDKSSSYSLTTYVKGKDSTSSGINICGDEFGPPKKKTKYSMRNIKEGGLMDYDNNETIDCKKLYQGKDLKSIGRCSVRLTKIQPFSDGKTHSCDRNMWN